MACFNYLLSENPSSIEDRYTITFNPISRPLLPTWKDEIEYEVNRLANTVNRQFFICMSGGIDSEVIARTFHELKVPFMAITIRYKDNKNEHDIKHAIKFCNDRRIPQTFIDIDPIPFLTNVVEEGIANGYENIGVYRYLVIWLMSYIEKLKGCAILGGGLQQYRVKNGTLCIRMHHNMFTPQEYVKRTGTQHFPTFFSNTPEVYAAYQEDPLITFMLKNPDYFKTYMGNDISLEKILVMHKLWHDLAPRTKYHGYENIINWIDAKQLELDSRFPHLGMSTLPIWKIREELGLPKLS